MIRLSLLAAAAALALPMAALAQSSDPALDAFESVCGTAGGAYTAVVQAASPGAGWADTPVVADDDPAVSVTDKLARTKSVGGVDLTLLATRGLRHTKSGDIPVSTCKISTNKADPALLPAAQSWVGSAPDAAPDSTLAVYYVKPGPGKPNHIGQAGLNDAMAAGGFAILKFQENADSAILVYQTYSK
jgi:hypothetical protein